MNEDDDTLLLDEPIEEEDQEEGQDRQDTNDADENDDVISFDGEDGSSEEVDLPKHLRAEIKRRDRRIKELEAAIPPKPKVVVGDRPNLDDFWGEGDPQAAYDAAMDAWRDRKAAAEAQDREQEEAQQARAKEWQGLQASFRAGVQALKYPDKDKALKVAIDTLSETQQEAIARACNNPALVMFALGKNPTRLDKLSEESNLIKFIADAVRLEEKMKVGPRRTAPEPESIPQGSARVSVQSKDKHLERLEKEAEKTGDSSKLVAYKRSLKKAA